jgi:DNA polymerase I-like protein with 3'-5' exonuclease and polymerase domains
MAYPTWHAIPSNFAEQGSSDSKEGGTIQGRITCSKPARQTFPDWMDECVSTRFPCGCRIHADMSQIELRVAGLLSGDPVILDAYRSNPPKDLHTDLAHRAFPQIAFSDPLWKKVYRQAGKHARFAILFRGGADAVMRALKNGAGDGLDVESLCPMSKCEELVVMVRNEHPVLWRWQDDLIDLAGRQGYLELPTGWGRTFSGGVRVVRDTYTPDVCNCEVQTLAAQLVQSAQFAIGRDLRKAHLKAVMDTNIYDALEIDCPPTEVDACLEIIRPHLTVPPLLPIMEQQLGRSCPMAYEVKVLHPCR